MSESQLNREFSKRDVQRMRNIVTGNTANRTRVQAGYEKESKEYTEGDIWEENGKQWTIKDGLKQTVTKHDKLREMVTLPLTCSCGKPMKANKLNRKMWVIHKKCFSCVIEHETQLRANGGYEEYKKQLLNSNKDTFVQEYEQAVDAFLNEGGDTFVSEAGDIENWSKAKINPEVIKALKDNIQRLKEIEL